MDRLDVGVTSSKVMYSKIAGDHIIIRTYGQITVKLKTCMYLAEPMNLFDFGVMRSKDHTCI